MGTRIGLVCCVAAVLAALLPGAACAKPKAGETEVEVRPIVDMAAFPLAVPLPPRWLDGKIIGRDETGRVYFPALVNSGKSEYITILLRELKAGKTVKVISKKVRGATPPQATSSLVGLKQSGSDLEITLSGQPFATLRTGGPRPYFWPVWAPGQVEVTRNYPMKDVEGEDKDHPHHRGFWFTHGDVNGVDFWTEGDGKGRIVTRELKTEPVVEGAIVKLVDDWIGPDGKKVCEDEQTFVFWGMDNPRVIDVFLCLKATDGPLTFGDTKEGSFAIRLPKWMTVKAGSGHMLNSERNEDANVWGKRAKWVDSWGTTGNQTVGVTFIESPDNPRFPSYWHARDYGLFAANPFGIKDFAGAESALEPISVKQGEQLELRYRVVLHRGDARAAGIENFANLTLALPKR